MNSRVVLSVITGRGKHSKDGDPKVLPAVRSWLDAAGLPYVERVGCLEVELTPDTQPSGSCASDVGDMLPSGPFVGYAPGEAR